MWTQIAPLSIPTDGMPLLVKVEANGDRASDRTGDFAAQMVDGINDYPVRLSSASQATRAPLARTPPRLYGRVDICVSTTWYQRSYSVNFKSPISQRSSA